MKAFICLAISLLLIGLLYVYVRQQFVLLENHVEELKSVIKLMAQPEVKVKVEKKEEACEAMPKMICVSDDESDSESDDESTHANVPQYENPSSDEKRSIHHFNTMQHMGENVQVAQMMMQGNDLMHLMQQLSFPQFGVSGMEIEDVTEPAVEIEDVTEPAVEIEELTNLVENSFASVMEIEEITTLDLGVKKVSVNGYENLSVKDLKEKVQQQGGPSSLKTKKQLIEYLEKNISA